MISLNAGIRPSWHFVQLKLVIQCYKNHRAPYTVHVSPILNCSKLVSWEKGSLPIETSALWHILRTCRFGKLSVGNVKIRFPIKLSSSNWEFDVKNDRSVSLLYARDSFSRDNFSNYCCKNLIQKVWARPFWQIVVKRPYLE